MLYPARLVSLEKFMGVRPERRLWDVVSLAGDYPKPSPGELQGDRDTNPKARLGLVKSRLFRFYLEM